MKRTAAVAAVVGLATGLGLGITGIAGAVGGGPSPAPATSSDRPHPQLKAFRHDRQKHRGGVVTAVTPTSLTVATPRGSQTVTTDDSTKYFVGRQAATRAAVRVG